MNGFGLDHLPYGVFSVDGGPRRVGVRYDDGVLDLAAATGRAEFARPSLNAFLALGRPAWQQSRAEARSLLEDGAPTVPLETCAVHLPVAVADYVDFYASEHHATNAGRILRPDGDPLLPNWHHLPVGYHGRAGTVVVSGTPIPRPRGQSGPGRFGPTARLDFEAELGFVVGAPSAPGRAVPAAALAEHVFGVVGLNDWSARDLQAWEMAPLGPFLGKSFATSIGAWVTPLDALDAAWCPLPRQDPRPLDYLDPDRSRGLDVAVEVLVNGTVLATPPFSAMYWGPGQLLAHLTVNGASLRTGDLFASGTISGPGADQLGCLLELTHAGQQPLADGRTWLDDDDEVVLRYSAPAVGGGRLTLAEVTGRVRPAPAD